MSEEEQIGARVLRNLCRLSIFHLFFLLGAYLVDWRYSSYQIMAAPIGLQILFSASVFLTLGSFSAVLDQRIKNRLAMIFVVANGILFLWLSAIVYHSTAGFYRGTCIHFDDCLYFSMVTFTTLGYGDFAPPYDFRFVAAFQALMGYIFLGLIIAAITNATRSIEADTGDLVTWDYEDIINKPWWKQQAPSSAGDKNDHKTNDTSKSTDAREELGEGAA